ncbi:restriction endonuclease [Desulfurococcaceae archaeon MEX13E-LK6-19]|nr:restriction endonuclease [Desulfurococcaceae archaeon MEX13E-LK6-19]
MVSPKRRWRSSERIAVELLESLGYRVIELRKKIKIDGVEVGEVDAIVEDENGVRYAVEIKAGTIDVTGLRQAYVNALVLGLKPLVIAKGYSDESAEALAKELGIKVILLSDYFLVEAEELELLIKEAFESIIVESINTIMVDKQLTPEEKRVIEAIATCPTIADAAKTLSTDINSLVKKIRFLQNKGLIPRSTKSYSMIRYYASLLLLKQKINEVLELIKASVSK